MSCNHNSDGTIQFTDEVSGSDIKNIIDELGGVPYSPAKLVQNEVQKILNDHVSRAVDAIERGDDIEAAQAIAQTVAVAAAWVAGTAFGWSTKLPLKGLDLVFQSFKDQGFMGGVLERLGVSQPNHSSKNIECWKRNGVRRGICVRDK